MNNAILFKINEDAFIQILIPYPVQELECCEIVTITLNQGQQSYIVYQHHCIQIAMEYLNFLLNQAIKQKLQVHPSIVKNLGYLANEYFNESPNEKLVLTENNQTWIGMNYSLWSPREVGTWIYNRDAEIFLEVTPLYRWHFSDPEEGENFITYEEFLKNYKLYLLFKLSKEVALEWLNKTEELLSIMKRNYEQCKYLHQAEVSSID
ncbi:MAG: hypothetical protein H0T84_12880 [Tatlockia sp.]|nr:hypothetical protein [Tatlockia sp.]